MEQITEELARKLARALISCPDGGSWVDELSGTEDSLTEWLVEWFKREQEQ